MRRCHIDGCNRAAGETPLCLDHLIVVGELFGNAYVKAFQLWYTSNSAMGHCSVSFAFERLCTIKGAIQKHESEGAVA